MPEGNARRRVTGLRREEVALLAGISADYYLRLEQGRGGIPSQEVLRSLARALRLDDAATGYLTSLGMPAAVEPPPTVAAEETPETVKNLLKILPLPAFVAGQYFDILAANDGARKLSPELVPGRNRLRSFFLVQAEKDLYSDWDTTARRFVAVVRDTIGRGATRPDFLSLISELSEQSPTFRELWNRHDVVNRDTEPALLRHPVVGPLRLNLEQLNLAGVPGQYLVIYHPTAGSPDADRLVELLNTP